MDSSPWMSLDLVPEKELRERAGEALRAAAARRAEVGQPENGLPHDGLHVFTLKSNLNMWKKWMVEP